MQITLQESEILDALEDYVRSKIQISQNQQIIFDLKAGRGENGFTATLVIVANDATETTKSKSANKTISAKSEKKPKLTDDGPLDLTAEAEQSFDAVEEETSPKVSIFGKSA